MIEQAGTKCWTIFHPFAALKGRNGVTVLLSRRRQNQKSKIKRPQQRPALNRKFSSAFTLIELLVAISITLIMLVVINQILHSTTEAVSLGHATGDINTTSWTVGAQMKRDFAAMLPPAATGGGLIVIINRKIGDLNGDDTFSNATGDGIALAAPGREVTRNFVRSDHVVFLRSADGLESLCPSSRTNLSYDHPSTPDAVRVWYGHGLRTNPDGTSDSGAVLGGAQNQGLNVLASNWILARHAMFFHQSHSSTNFIMGYANNAPVSATLGAGLLAHHGVADISNVSLANLHLALSAAYTIEAPKLAFDSNRLWVNPTLRGAEVATGVSDATDATIARELAKMHPMLASHVSDFIVEFAGDYETNGGAANTAPDGVIDVDTDNNIKWYSDFGSPVANAWPGTFQPVPDTSDFATTASGTRPIYLDQANGGIFIFHHQDLTHWPHLIRMRFRIHDPKGKVGTATAADPGDPNDPRSGKWVEMVLRVKRK